MPEPRESSVFGVFRILMHGNVFIYPYISRIRIVTSADTAIWEIDR